MIFSFLIWVAAMRWLFPTKFPISNFSKVLCSIQCCTAINNWELTLIKLALELQKEEMRLHMFFFMSSIFKIDRPGLRTGLVLVLIIVWLLRTKVCKMRGENLTINLKTAQNFLKTKFPIGQQKMLQKKLSGKWTRWSMAFHTCNKIIWLKI